jgi:hypothetical protein
MRKNNNSNDTGRQCSKSLVQSCNCNRGSGGFDETSHGQVDTNLTVNKPRGRIHMSHTKYIMPRTQEGLPCRPIPELRA